MEAVAISWSTPSFPALSHQDDCTGPFLSIRPATHVPVDGSHSGAPCRTRPLEGTVADATERFVGRFLRPAQDAAHEREVILDIHGWRSATLFLPRQVRDGCPAWVILQGVTVRGRHHDAARRLARSLPAAGHVVIAPDVPSWTDLRVDPRDAEPTVRAALARLDECPELDRSRIGLMGLSAAGTWALEVAAGELAERLRAVGALAAY